MAVNIFPTTGDTISESSWTTLNKAIIGNANVISEGFGMWINTGLNVNVGNGVAIVDGKVVEITTDTSKSLTANSTEYITINSSGTIQARTSGWVSTEAKIGTVTTGASSITGISQYRPVDTGLVQMRILEADHTRTSSTTYVNLNDLKFDMGVTGSTWHITWVLRVSTDATPDLKLKPVAYNGSLSGGIICLNGAPASTQSHITNANENGPEILPTGMSYGASPCIIQAIACANADDAVAKIQFAQAVSSTDATTIHKDSFMVAFRIA